MRHALAEGSARARKRLNRLPLERRSGGLRRWRNPRRKVKIPIVPFFISHRGCPHRCIFCDQEKIAGVKRHLSLGSGNTGQGGGLSTIQAVAARWKLLSMGEALPVFRVKTSCGFCSLFRSCLPPVRFLPSGFPPGRMPLMPPQQPFSLLRESLLSSLASSQWMMRFSKQSERGHCAADVEKAVACLKGEGITRGTPAHAGTSRRQRRDIRFFSHAGPGSSAGLSSHLPHGGGGGHCPFPVAMPRGAIVRLRSRERYASARYCFTGRSWRGFRLFASGCSRPRIFRGEGRFSPDRTIPPSGSWWRQSSASISWTG